MGNGYIDHEILIVGAGFSGIGLAIALDKAGISEWLMVDDGSSFGGVWAWNTYPGVGVDIPSFSYQFSFEKRPDWSRIYAPGEELRDYARHCADRYGLRHRTRFGTRLAVARYDENAHRWHAETTDGETLSVRYLLDATGVLKKPQLPEIPGIEDFAGPAMHTARWDDAVDVRGLRVGIIGTGPSAVQVVPAIASDVAHLTVFQRTPVWCVPKADVRIPRLVRALLRKVPGAQAVVRGLSQLFVEMTFSFPAHYHRALPVGNTFERLALAYLRSQVSDPELRAKLTPDYPMGCKRPGFNNEYLSTFERSNVDLETNPIARVTADAVVTADGRTHDVDVLVLATGFKVFGRGSGMPAFPIAGRKGQDLGEWWAEHRHQAYEGVSVPGFPNYFSMCGPYGYNGGSYFHLVETQARHIVRCLRHARDNRATEMEVSGQANTRYFDEMLRRRKRQIFWQDGCRGVDSFQYDDHGDVPLRPSLSPETAWRSAHFPLTDYALASDPAAALAATSPR